MKLKIAMVIVFLIGAAIPAREHIVLGYAHLLLWHRQVEAEVEKELWRREVGNPPPTFTRVVQ